MIIIIRRRRRIIITNISIYNKITPEAR